MIKLSVHHQNQCTRGHAWSRTVTPFQRSIVVATGSTVMKNALVMCLTSMWHWLHYGFLVSPEIKDWGLHVGGLYLENWVFVHIYWYKLFTYTETNFLVLKCHQINQEVCSNILDTLYKLQWFQYIYIYIYIYMCGTIWHTFKTSKVALWNVCKIMVVPILPHVCENLIVTKPYDRGVEMANITFLKMTAQHTPPDHKWNEEIWKE